jgi:hypothetical protein
VWLPEGAGAGAIVRLKGPAGWDRAADTGATSTSAMIRNPTKTRPYRCNSIFHQPLHAHPDAGKTFPDIPGTRLIHAGIRQSLINIPIWFRRGFSRAAGGRDRSCNCRGPVFGKLYQDVFPDIPEFFFEKSLRIVRKFSGKS